jgi:phosphoribosylformimino-5-aminoimidazole carboxamide ribotide isomerase
MLIIPAIDLLGGKVVRLEKGLEKTAKVYSDNPGETARAFEAAGARWIHVVDLDAAFGRPGVNFAAVDGILNTVRVPLELGGGVRSEEQIRFWIWRGIGRVVLGSAAVKNPDLVLNAVAEFGPESVVVGIDLRNGRVSIHGWTEDVELDGEDLAGEMRSLGVERIIVTDITTDGMLAGPNLAPINRIAESTGLRVILSGGVSGHEDLERIRREAVPGIEGVVVGKAVYEGRLSLADAIVHFQNPQTGTTT